MKQFYKPARHSESELTKNDRLKQLAEENGRLFK